MSFFRYLNLTTGILFVMATESGCDWLVYIILADDGSFYTGITTDIYRRWHQHKEGKGGAKYFRGRKPMSVIYLEDAHSRSSASQREAAIKKLNRQDKETLILASTNKVSSLLGID